MNAEGRWWDGLLRYRQRRPVSARAITNRWISLVPS
jgi:hypothetical protein